MICPTSLDELLHLCPDCVLLECISGSHAYGLNRPDSDEDRRGIFIVPSRAYQSVQVPPAQLSDKKSDVTFYSLRRFAELAAASNPNMLELLFSPAECILRSSPHLQPLLQHRDAFLSRACFASHVAYATAQIHKAKGQNKWINRPQPEEPPRQEDFCWFIPWPGPPGAPPARPMRFTETTVRLDQCHAAAVEHSGELFRLYDYGSESRGVFRGDNLVLESIPLGHETARFVGLMIFSRNAYEAAARDHHNYWEWRRSRNEARWHAQEKGGLDYDAKNLMHTFRLLMAAESLLRDGTLRVRPTENDRAYLSSVRNGDFAYSDLIAQAQRRTDELARLLPDSPLPETPNLRFIDELVQSVVKSWEEAHA